MADLEGSAVANGEKRAMGRRGTYKGGRALRAIVVAWVALSAPLAQAATFTVSNLNDSGAGSFRQAIIDANAAGAGPHTIDVTVTGTVNLLSALPSVAQDITVSGVGTSNFTLSGNSFPISGGIGTTVNSTGTTTLDTVGGAGSLTKLGVGTLILNGTSSYTGGTTVTTGTLQGDTNSLQGNITNNAAVTFDQGFNGTYGSAMIGTGSLTKQGIGILTLTGANTYSGGTTITAGALQGDTVSLQGNITNNASLIFDQAGAGTFAGAISGTGSLTKQSGGTLTLSGTNTYGGGTTVSGGTLQGNSTSLQGNITNNATVTFDQAAGGTYAGVMSGTGTLNKQGLGTLTLSGTNTYTGGTTVTAGTLQGDTASLQGNITNNAAVTFDQAAAGTYGGVISGTGSLTKQNGGILTLSGTNTYTGGTTVTAGTLQGDANSVQGDITNNAAVVFNQTIAGTYSGSMIGTGSLTKQGGGTLTLTGTNTYSGGTTVSGGVLQGDSASLQGNISNSASVVFDQTGAGTYSGVISGTGSFSKLGAGLLTLSGANTYSGGTTVSAGTLQGDTTSLQGDITNNAAITFNQAAGGTYAGSINGTGSLTKQGAGTLTFTGTHTYSGGTTISGGAIQGDTTNLQGNITNNAAVIFDQAAAGTYGGVISGTGSLTKLNTGTLTLSGGNTYSGGTTVTGGVLLGDTTSLQGDIANNATVTFNQGLAGTYGGSMTGTGILNKQGAGTLILGGANTYSGGTTVNAGTLQGDATSLQGNITNNAAVTFDQSGAGTYAGVMSGTGTMTKQGAGTLTLSGANSYSGGTTVSDGTLQGDATSLQGDIVNDSIVTFNQTGAGTYSGAMSGGGTLVKQGTGTLTLDGANSYSGGTTVTNGAIQSDTNSLQGDIANNASVIFDQGVAGTHTGNITGTGSVTKQGVGTLTLNGTNTYSGGTTVGAGTLQGDTTSLQGDITNNAAVIFNQGAAGTYSGSMSGTGSLTKQGGGVLTLDGANTYSGGTTINAGTLQGSSASLQGNITNNAALIFDQAIIGTYGGVISGAGSVTKQGVGTLTLSGANTYTGGTTVSAGELQGDAVSLQGDINNNATVTFNQAAAGTYSGNMSGSGSLVKQGGGLLQLDGTNTYTGGTTVSGGSIQGDTTGVQGDIANNGAVIFDQAVAGTYSGIISGSGSVTKQGVGTLTMSGVNTYTGGTTVAAGTLQGDATSLQGNITNNSAVVFDQTGAGTYSGSIAGAGSVTKQGTGILTLSGSNSYTGGTTINAGTLQGDSASLQGNITNNSALIFDQTIAGTYGDIISGAGTVTKQGAGTLTLSGANTYTGGTTITDGTLQGDATSLQGDIVNNSNLTFNQAAGGTYGNIISGTGSVTKLGGGTLTLSGANSYSGGTTVSGGTLEGDTTSLQGNITNNAAVTFNQAGAGTYSGSMSGSGSIDKTGLGTLTLDGTNTYSGGTTVSAGTLQGDTDSLQGNIANNATVVFDQAGAGTYSGSMSGTGVLTKQGAGTLTLNGPNSYSGGTNINAGTLQGDTNSLQGNITNNANLIFDQAIAGTFAGVISGTGGVTKQNAGTLTLSGANTYSGGTTVSAGTLVGDTTSLQGDIANNATLTFDQMAAGTYAGVVSGTGVLNKQGTGTLTLSGANTYTGGTNVSVGTLQGDATSLQGDITNNSVVVFDQTGAGTYLGDMTGTGSLTKQGAGTLTLSGTHSYTGGTTVTVGTLQGDTDSLQGNIVNNADVTFDQTAGGTYSGVMSGGGTLTKQGAGTLILSGANTYSGGTNVNAGTLQGNTSSLQGNITNNADVTFDQGVAGTYGGIISGTGTLTKQGAGTLTLNGANTYSGGTTVSDGILRGDATSLQGDIANNAAVTFDQTGAGTYGGNMTGTGSLTKLGTGTLTLGGTNTYSGGTTVTAGTLQGNAANLQGDIVNNAAVTFDETVAGTYSGDMSGSGSLTKQGAGTLTLDGANTYSGGTTVNAGTLQGDADSLQGDIANNAAVVFDQTAGGTYSGDMSGTGSLTKQGAGTLILDGANTYSGGTTVNAGTLQGDSNSLQGNIANNADVTFDQAVAGTYGGIISGTGTLTKQGVGTLTLSGANTYSGGTTVTDGTLRGDATSLQGDIANDATVTFDQTGAGTYAGNITGTGVLTKEGTGTLTLSGTNTYSGGTTVNNGTLQGDTTSLQGDIANNATVTFDQLAAGTYSGIMSGSGSLTKQGAGTLTLDGANTYTGGTNVNVGTLQGDAASLQGDIVNSATVVFDQTGAGTYAGNMSGTGVLTKQGIGTLTLSGTNSYSGGTNVNAGTLQGNSTSLQGNINNAANVTFDQGATGTYAGVISGTGTLTKEGTGTLILSGANTYSGGTTVNDGNLEGNVTSLQGDIVNNASVTFDQAVNGTYAGNMSGTGGLIKDGAGTLTLGGTNTYTGGTTINDGTIEVNGGLQGDIINNSTLVFDEAGTSTFSDNISGTGDVVKQGVGTVTLDGVNSYTGGTTVAAGTLQGDTDSLQGAITNNGTVVFDQTAAGTYSGNMSGTGILTKQGTGTLTLDGVNTYSGGTNVNAGVLQGDTDSLQGNIASSASVIFDQAVAGTYGGILSGTGTLTKQGAGTLTLTGANTYSGGTTVTDGTLRGDSTSLQGDIANNSTVTFDQGAAGTYGGVMSGTGNLTKEGTGVLTLSGANTYSGGTTVNNGILQGDTTSLQGNIANNATVTFDQLAAGTYSGDMSGTGALNKQGAGTLTLDGTNTYSGGTNVNVGTLQGDADSLQGDIANNATVVFDQTGAGTYSGNMSGTGILTKQGTGTLTLDGVNSYSGGTNVNAGALQGDSDSLQGNIANSANVIFDQAVAGTYAGILSGTGTMTKQGAGTLTLTGANTYTGGTTVTDGTLQGDSTSLQGDIANNSTVTFNQGGAGTYGGVMSGTGNLTKEGIGTLTLSGANTYSGGTTVNNGTLQGDATSLQGNITNNSTVTFDQLAGGTYSGDMSGTGVLNKQGAGTLILDGANTYSGGTNVNVGTLQGDADSLQGDIANNAAVVFDQTGAGTYSGDMSGTGTLTKQGAGTLTLDGTNTYTGGTTVSAGTLQGDTNSLQGDIANSGDVTFDQTVAGNYGGILSGTGTLTKQGVGTLTLSGVNTYTGGTTVTDGVLQGDATSLQGDIANNAAVTFDQTGAGTYAGNMSGTGSLTKQGTGTLTLGGTNTYSGGTTVNDGTLQGNATSLQGDIANNATVTFDQVGAGTYSGDITGTGVLNKQGAGTLTLDGTNSYSGGTNVNAGTLQGDADSLQGDIANNAAVVFDQTGAGTYSGDMSGTGGLTKQGTGTLILDGNNSYTGGTTVTAGTLQGDTNSLQGNIANSSIVTFDQAVAGSYNDIISGTGSVTKQGLGTLTLGGANTYSGGTTVTAGTLQGDASSLQGDIANSATVTFDQTGAGTYAGVISGTGNLTKQGTGTLTLSGANTYSGGTTVSDGTLQGDTTSLQGDITNNAAVTFDQLAAGTYSGVMSGTGSLTKQGAGTLTLDGANTYSGGTIVNVGTLQGDATSLQGDITNNDTVVFDQTGAGTYGGNMSGTGALTKQGTGTLTLSGTNSYGGGTNVNAGTLRGDSTSLQGNIANSANVTFDQTTTGTYAGVISGTGTLTKDGAGTLILSGANTYSGGTTVNDGNLEGDVTSLQGDIVNNASVTFEQGVNGTYAGNMSGTGGLIKNGAGTLTLGGTNTYTGGTTINDGTIEVNGGLQGDIINNSTLVFDEAGTSTFSDNISGTGNVVKQGVGTVTLDGVNSYTGGTNVLAGTLQGDTDSLQGDIANAAAVVFNQPTDGTYSGTMSGTGTLTKQGAGTLTLSGPNSYSGGTTVTAGTLAGDSTSLQGDIANSAVVLFDQALAGTYGGIISGAGSVTKQGAGTLTLSGANTYTGGTTVLTGTLEGDGTSLQGDITNNANVTFDQTGAGTYAGIMNGTGTLTKEGTGTLTLTGANGYSGGTIVSNGTLQGDATSLQGDIANSANVTFDEAVAGTYSGVISGTGSLTKIGAGTLTLNGANTYSGGTNVNVGTLQGDATSLQGNINNSAAVVFDQTLNGTYNGSIVGTGSVTKQGAGTLTMVGTNGYTGGTTVTAGTLQGDADSLQGAIANNSVVTFDQTGTGTYAGAMTGTGVLIKEGAGTLVLSGANLYGGGTTVNDGTLQGNTTSLQGDILNNSDVTFNQTALGTYSGIISGNGTLTKIGAGTLVVDGANTYTGGTTVSTGTLQGNSTSLQGDIVNNASVAFNEVAGGTYSGAISGTGNVLKLGAGTLVLDGANTYTGGTTVATGTLQGNAIGLQGDIDNNAAVVFDQTIAGTYSGTMTGTGSLTKQGGGTLTLDGANSYTGGTTVAAGTLRGDTNSLQGAILNNAAVSFDQTFAGTYGGVISGTGSLTKDGSGTVILTGSNSYAGGTTVVDGTLQGDTTSLQGDIDNHSNVTFNETGTGTYFNVITGTGTLTKIGAGTLTLTGAHTYSGGTIVTDGTLRGDVTALQGNILNDANVTFDQGGAGTYSGVMSGIGTLTKEGAGTLTLTGANTYTGGTTVTTGTLQGDATSLQGNINNNAIVTFDQLFAGTYSGSMSGTGSLTKQGGGTLTLDGANTYTGGTTVTAGTLQGDSNSLQGAIVNNSSVTFDQAFDGSYGGNMSGSGSLTKQGTGTLTLSGTNSYSGGTNVLAGVLEGDATSLQGDINNQADVTFNQAGTGTYSNIISGTGSVTKEGAGTLILDGANTYSGGTFVNAGTLQGDTTGLQGDIQNDADVTFDLAGAGTYSGVMSGTGTLTKIGTGTLTLDGANTYTGGTNVNFGILQGDTSSLQGDINNSAEVVFDQLVTGTYSGSISGSGVLTKQGTGTLILDGTHSYTGGTNVNAGILQGDASSLQGNIANNATVVFDQVGAGTYGGIMSGAGALTKQGAGTLTLTGANLYTGGTNVLDGVLEGDATSLQGDINNQADVTFNQLGVGNYGGIISGTGSVTKEGAGTLVLSGANTYSGGTFVNTGNLQGDATSLQGDIDNDATVTFDQTGTGTYSGVMSGTGVLVKDNTGTLILDGVNTYTGGTTVTDGILRGDATSVQGDITNNASVVFDQVATGTYSGAMIGTGSLTKLGAGTLILDGANGYLGGTTVTAGILQGDASSLQGDIANNATVVFDQTGAGTYSGIMSGTGVLTKQGSGTLTLTGANLYGGGTNVLAGVLRGDATSLQGDIFNQADVTFDQLGVGNYNGIISGTGSVTKEGAGTLVLGGANLYSGGTFVNAGTLEGDATSLQGNIDNDAQVVFDQTGTGTYSGVMSGTGELVKQNTGTLILDGANTYSGGTTVSGGVLQGDATSIQGDITNNATVTFDQLGVGTYSGSMIGTGTLTKQGVGTLILDGANSYSGGTTVTAGVLQGDSDSLQGNIANSASVVFDQAVAGVYSGVMSGAGSLTKQGAGTLTLTGTNLYTGGTFVLAGTLEGNSTSLQGDIDNDANVTFDQAVAGTYGDVISGTGTVTKEGAGTLTLTGANTYSGGTIVTDGTLQGDATSLQGNIANNSIVAFDQVGAGTYSGVMSGTGQLLKLNTGTLTLDGANTYTGGTTVTDGILQGDATSIQGDITNNATVVFDQLGTGTYSGSMIGSGNLTKQGNGTLILDGTHGYTGGTTVSAGTLQGDADSLQGDILNNSIVTFDQTGTGTYAGIMSGSGELNKDGTGTLILSGANIYTGGTNVIDGTLQGDATSLQGDIDNDANVTFDQAGSGTYNGIVSGSGTLTKEGTGTLILGGANTYSGGTFVNDGTLQGDATSLQGDIANSSTVVFDQLGTGTYSGVMSGTGDLVKQNTGTLILDGANTYSGGTTVDDGVLQGNATSIQGDVTNNGSVVFDQLSNGTYSGSMVGTGSMTKQGGGTLILDGINGYSGGTTVNAGVLQGDADSLQGDIANNATVTFDQVGAGTYSGVISGGGLVIKQGAGALTLTGTNLYTGGTTISAGELIGDTNSLQGAINNNAVLTFNQTFGGTFNDIISGTGSLTKLGSGTVTLAGANTYSGGTTIVEGTLQGDATSLQGNILNNAALVFDQAGTGTYSEVISGSGTVTKQGLGTLIFDGANTFTSDMTISAGILQIDTNSLVSDINNNASLVFDQTFTGTYSGDIFGTGSLLKQNNGTVILDGVNTYTGGTTITDGVLQGDTDSLQGLITNNASLVFDQAFAGTYGSVIDGTGTLAKRGVGELTLTGANTFSGLTSVEAGRLVVDGSLLGPVDVLSGADLQVGGTLFGTTNVLAGGELFGIGTLANTNVSGRIAPGNSIGTLTVNGSYVQNAGSTYVVELNDAGTVAGVNNDLINVVGAPGTATINGGTVDVQAAPGTYSPGTTYTILQSAGGVLGPGYTTVLDNLPTGDFILVYNANSIDLVVQGGGIVIITPIALTPNQLSVSDAIDAISLSPSGDMTTIISELGSLSDSARALAMEQMAGELHGTMATVGLNYSSHMTQLLRRKIRSLGPYTGMTRTYAANDPLIDEDKIALVGYEEPSQFQAYVEADPYHSYQHYRTESNLWDGWLLGYGLGGSLSDDGNATGADHTLIGTLFGINRWIDSTSLAGIYGGYGRADVEVLGPNQTGTMDSLQVGGYLRQRLQKAYWLATAGLSFDSYDTSRVASFGLVNRVINGSYSGRQFLASAEGGLIRCWGNSQFTPLTALQYIYLGQNDFTETGGDSLNLSVDSMSAHSLRALLGVEFKHSFSTGAGCFVTRAHGAVMQEFLDNGGNFQARFQTANSPTINIRGVETNSTWGLLGIGMDAQFGNHSGFFLNYDLQLNADDAFHVGSGGFQYRM